MAQAVLYYKSDNVIEVANLKNADANSFLNAATVEVTLVDKAGVAVGGQTWPLELSYVTGSNGKYKGTLSYALEVKPNTMYTARISANAGTGLRRYFELPLLVTVG